MKKIIGGILTAIVAICLMGAGFSNHPIPHGHGTLPLNTTWVLNYKYTAASFLLGTEGTVHQIATFDAKGKKFKHWPTWTIGASVPGKGLKYCNGPSNPVITKSTNSKGLQTDTYTASYFFSYSDDKCSTDYGVHMYVDDYVDGSGAWNNNGDHSKHSGPQTISGKFSINKNPQTKFAS